MIYTLFVVFIRTFEESTCDPLDLDNGLGGGCHMILHRSPIQWLHNCERTNTSITLLIFTAFGYVCSTSSVLKKELIIPETVTSNCQDIETCNNTLIEMEVGEGVIKIFVQIFGYIGFLCKVWSSFIKRIFKS